MTGITSMPYPWIDGDDNLYQIQELCKVASYYDVFSSPSQLVYQQCDDRK